MVMTEKHSLMWHISFFSSIAGECCTVSADGMAWWSKELKAYWLWLEWDADDKVTEVMVDIRHPGNLESYAIIGYCHTSKLKYVDVIGKDVEDEK